MEGSNTLRKEEKYDSKIPFINAEARFYIGYDDKNFEKILQALNM